jgi:hypothetical protein
MTKKVRTKTTPCDINYIGIDDVIKTLENLRDKFGNNGYLSFDDIDSCSYHYKVEETDAEYSLRTSTEREAIEECILADLAVRKEQYERLKKEFE